MTDKTKPSKGGRKGGTQFPRIPLNQAVEYAKKLVGKTHTGPQNATIILKGVFNSATDNGKIRASALKQFGLLEGGSDAYNATDLARAINSAPPEELTALYMKACLVPKPFRTLFDTFQNDKVSRAKIRQQALALDVHPDSADSCVDLFVQSLQFAGMASFEGEEIVIASAPATTPDNQLESAQGSNVDSGDSATAPKTSTESSDHNDEEEARPGAGSPATASSGTASNLAAAPGMNVTLNLDSTMDPEKLERQLKLLRQYGVLK